jgi:hypothetical protein
MLFILNVSEDWIDFNLKILTQIQVTQFGINGIEGEFGQFEQNKLVWLIFNYLSA